MRGWAKLGTQLGLLPKLPIHQLFPGGSYHLPRMSEYPGGDEISGLSGRSTLRASRRDPTKVREGPQRDGSTAIALAVSHTLLEVEVRTSFASKEQ